MYRYFDRLDNYSIIILDHKKIRQDMKITVLACIHSGLQLFQITMAAILDFGKGHFVCLLSNRLKNYSILILNHKNLWIDMKIISIHEIYCTHWHLPVSAMPARARRPFEKIRHDENHVTKYKSLFICSLSDICKNVPYTWHSLQKWYRLLDYWGYTVEQSVSLRGYFST